MNFSYTYLKPFNFKPIHLIRLYIRRGQTLIMKTVVEFYQYEKFFIPKKFIIEKVASFEKNF